MSWGKKTEDPAKKPDAVCKGVVPCPKAKAVSVAITLSQAVACPGHPLSITAAGSPAGGTYAWTIAGGSATLVDGAGVPLSTGDHVFLRSFSPDDATGTIPAQNTTVSVTYSHPDGTATDSKPVPVHEIKFDITNMVVTGGVTQANETAAGVTMGAAPGTPTMITKPKIKIKLEASCPRKADCAKNHRAGWLQTVTANTRKARYTHTLVEVTVALPIRDGDNIAGPSPHPFYDAAHDFTGDATSVDPEHQDSPAQGAAWTDSRAGAPAPPPPKNLRLRTLAFINSFDAWLVVQNKEWKDHDLPGSFAYQRQFTWTAGLSTAVDTTQAVGSRCAVPSSNAGIGAVSNGKGGRSPDLGAAVPNDTAAVNETAAAGI